MDLGEIREESEAIVKTHGGGGAKGGGEHFERAVGVVELGTEQAGFPEAARVSGAKIEQPLGLLFGGGEVTG